jgi:membrane-bound metal-dependent hydrolase YbcI (DUF457 family)
MSLYYDAGALLDRSSACERHGKNVDNLTHSLFAIAVSRTLAGGGRGTTATLVLASNAPDVDIIATAAGALSYLQWHRGPTHGPLGVVTLGLTAAAVIYAGRWTLDRGNAAKYGSFADLALFGVLGALGHVLMDIPTSYGTRILSPFDWRWYAADLMPIIDVYLLVVLAAGLLAGRRSAVLRRRSAAVALALMLANYGVRAYTHGRAVDVAPEAFGGRLPARCDERYRQAAGARNPLIDRWPAGHPAPHIRASCLVEIAAIPEFGSPFRWRIVARLSDAYEIASIDLLQRPVRPHERAHAAPLRVPNQWTPAAVQAAGTEVGRIFLGFSRFPAVRTTTGEHETIVRWDDMRFRPRPGADERNGRSGTRLFAATVRLDPLGQVTEQELGP